MKSSKLFVVATALTAVLSAHGQTAAPAPAASAVSSPAKHELALQLVALQQASIENVARSVATRPAEQLWQAATNALQTQVPPEKRDAAAAAVQGHLKKFVDDVSPQWANEAVKLAPTTLAPMLEAQMSEDELRQLITVLQSSAFKKWNESMPQMQQALVQSLVQQMSPVMDPKLKALEQTVVSDLGLPPAGASDGAASAPTTGKKHKK